jgi:hypothetical protein
MIPVIRMIVIPAQKMRKEISKVTSRRIRLPVLQAAHPSLDLTIVRMMSLVPALHLKRTARAARIAKVAMLSKGNDC